MIKKLTSLLLGALLILGLASCGPLSEDQDSSEQQ